MNWQLWTYIGIYLFSLGVSFTVIGEPRTPTGGNYLISWGSFLLLLWGLNEAL